MTFTLPERDIRLVIEAGGKRNAWTSGLLTELTRLGFDKSRIKEIDTASSAAFVASYLIAGQIEETPEIWIKELNGPDVFHPLNPLRGRRFGDPDRLVERGCKTLDIGAFNHSPTKLRVVLVELESAKTVYVRTDRENLFEVLRGACVVPHWGKPIYLDGVRVVDGGISDPLPVLGNHSAKQKLIVISNRPKGFRLRGILRTHIAPLSMFLGYPKARSILSTDLIKRYNQTQDWLDKAELQGAICVIRPSCDLGSLFTRNPKKLAEMVELGKSTAQESWPKLEALLAN